MEVQLTVYGLKKKKAFENFLKTESNLWREFKENVVMTKIIPLTAVKQYWAQILFSQYFYVVTASFLVPMAFAVFKVWDEIPVSRSRLPKGP